ncbi:isoaspartyl peptidase/L-asparaginase [Azotobacter sp. CWF10]
MGAVALDAQGQLAAGTSTGGATNKRYGRVGDSPIVSAGTWPTRAARYRAPVGASTTSGLRTAHEICARIRYQRQTPEQAGRGVINEMIPKMGGDGGAIVLAADGKWPCRSTPGHVSGWISADGVPMSQFSPARPCRSPGQ